MSRQPPEYVVDAGVIQSPISYDWNKDIELKLYAAKDQNVKLCHALDQSNYRAKFSIGIATTEWIIWRFEKHAKLDDAHNRIEAAWASAIDPAYARDLRFKLTRSSVFHESAIIDGPIKLALNFLGAIDAHYATGNIYLAAAVVKQVLVARHVISENRHLTSGSPRRYAILPKSFLGKRTTIRRPRSMMLHMKCQYRGNSLSQGLDMRPRRGTQFSGNFLKHWTIRRTLISVRQKK